MQRAAASILIGSMCALALAAVGVGVSCSTFNGEDEKEAGTTSSLEAGTDSPTDGGDRGDAADIPDVDTPGDDDAGDGGVVAVVPCTAGMCRLVFVTSVKVSGNIGGAAGADGVCTDEAKKNPLLASHPFKAWISEESNAASAANRISQSTGPYVRLDGTLVANDWTDLTDGNLLAPINVDPFGVVLLAGDVWTGTNTSGQTTGITCSSWRSAVGAVTGTAGRAEKNDGGWTTGKVYPCTSTMARLYCIESP